MLMYVLDILMFRLLTFRMVRDKLLTFGFGEALKLLQKYCLLDINHLISLADEVSLPTYAVTRTGNSVYVENTKVEPVCLCYL
jgi:hypothetical protein